MSGARPLYPATDPKNQRGPFRDRPTLRLNAKPGKWSHQNELASLVGKEIMVQFDDKTAAPLAAHWYKATLLNADAYTLQLEVDWFSLSRKSIVTYNKSAIQGYRAA